MKNSIIYLGVALLSLTNVFGTKAATITESANNLMLVDSFKIRSADHTYYLAQDPTILNPETLIQPNYVRTESEVIAADNQIIGNSTDDGLPSFKSKSQLEIINDDNKIIDALKVPVQPLILGINKASRLVTRTTAAKM